MIRFPGFIDICTNIPSGKWDAVSRTAVRSGYTSLIASPLSEEIFTEKPDVIRAMGSIRDALIAEAKKPVERVDS